MRHLRATRSPLSAPVSTRVVARRGSDPFTAAMVAQVRTAFDALGASYVADADSHVPELLTGPVARAIRGDPTALQTSLAQAHLSGTAHHLLAPAKLIHSCIVADSGIGGARLRHGQVARAVVAIEPFASGAEAEVVVVAVVARAFDRQLDRLETAAGKRRLHGTVSDQEQRSIRGALS